MSLTLLQIGSAAFLFHFLFYLSTNGWQLTTTNFLPVFGFRCNQFAKYAIVVFTVTVCVLGLLSSNILVAIAVSVALFLYIATASIRLSNHLLIIFFLVIGALPEFFLSVQDVFVYRKTYAYVILICMYLIAFFHKINSGFLNPDHSAALIMCDRYFWKFENIHLRRLVPLLVLVSYLIIPVFLSNSSLFSSGVLIALIMHFLFGVSGNPHFSFLIVLMYVLFVDIDVADSVGLVSAFAFSSMVTVYYLSVRQWLFVYNCLGTFLLFLFAFLSAYVGFQTWQVSPAFVLNIRDQSDLPQIIYLVLGALLALNGLKPYFYGKTEFSFAMFSNLRLDQKNHMIVNSDLVAKIYKSDYFKVTHVKNMHLARISEDRLVRHIAMLLDRRREFLYSAYFIKEANRFFARRGYFSVRAVVQDEGSLNSSPSNVLKPYMLPADKVSGVMG